MYREPCTQSCDEIKTVYPLLYPSVCAKLAHPISVFRWLRKDGPRAFAKLHLASQPFDQCPGEPWCFGTPKVLQQEVRAPWYPTPTSPWRVTITGFRYRDSYPFVVRKVLCYLCQIFQEHLAPTPMRIFSPAIRTPVWEARMRRLERRRHEEDPLYQVATYLAFLDQLFDEQASILREQTHRAE